MSTTMFRKKPVVVEATQWTGSLNDATRVINWVLSQDGTARYHAGKVAGDYCGHDLAAHHLAVDTLEGSMAAKVGDWIIRGVKGEFYPCKPDIFAATYDPAEPAPSQDATGAAEGEAVDVR